MERFKGVCVVAVGFGPPKCKKAAALCALWPRQARRRCSAGGLLQSFLPARVTSRKELNTLGSCFPALRHPLPSFPASPTGRRQLRRVLWLGDGPGSRRLPDAG
eukprot:214263-Chlamydomonas_euryale.AAC.3